MNPAITYVKGDATNPRADGNKIVIHVCNDIGVWGAGFVMAVSNKWQTPEMEYRKWHASGFWREPGAPSKGWTFALGSIQYIQVKPDVWVVNMIGQRGLQRPGHIPVSYTAIGNAMAYVSDLAKKLDASVHMPRIGCGLAGGNWESIEPLIQERLCSNGIAVTVYDIG
jgi:O-acetyl-ADP-ribose deacetylase (regulator of RNase III)